MNEIVKNTRNKVEIIFSSIGSSEYCLIDTTRDLQAIVDKKFADSVKRFRWYAVISGSDHIYAVADINGKRVSLQRYVLILENPTKTLDEIKGVSFVNKVSFDCRVSNLRDRVGRVRMMRNRKPKRNTSSIYKGVIKYKNKSGSPKWRTQIKADFGTMSIGTYDDEEWAATVYDAAAFLLFDGAGYYNFPETCPNIEAIQIARARINRFKLKKIRTDK